MTNRASEKDGVDAGFPCFAKPVILPPGRKAAPLTSLCWGVNAAEELSCHWCSLRRSRDPAPKAALLTPEDSSRLHIPPPPHKLTTFRNSGKVREAEAPSPKIRHGGTEMLVCPGGPQGPAQFPYQNSTGKEKELQFMNSLKSLHGHNRRQEQREL